MNTHRAISQNIIDNLRHNHIGQPHTNRQVYVHKNESNRMTSYNTDEAMHTLKKIGARRNTLLGTTTQDNQKQRETMYNIYATHFYKHISHDQYVKRATEESHTNTQKQHRTTTQGNATIQQHIQTILVRIDKHAQT